MRPTPADPAAWHAHLAEGNARQARKRVAVDVLLRDAAGRVLLVNPTYKPGWDLPGGMAEANESPEETATRELREELGLPITLYGLLVVDWVAPHGPWDDQLAFVFDGGTLDAPVTGGIAPCGEELSKVAFVTQGTAQGLLGDSLRNRFNAAMTSLRAGQTAYLHDGSRAW